MRRRGKILLTIVFILTLYTVNLSAKTKKYEVSADGTKQFTTIQAAIDHVAAGNIAESTDIVIYPGIYNEQLTLKTVAGSDKNKTIQLISSTGNSSDVTLSSNKTVINIQGSYYTISDITVKNVATTSHHGNVIVFNYNSYITDITIKNSKIQGYADAENEWETAVIMLGSANTNNNVTINNCDIINGSYSVFGSTSKEYFNINISNNRFGNYGAGGVCVSKSNEIKISNNTFKGKSFYTGNIRDIQLLAAIGNGIIERNIISMNHKSTNTGIYLNGNKSPGGLIIKNNYIYNSGNDASFVGIKDFSNSNIRYLHNTIRLNGTTNKVVKCIDINNTVKSGSPAILLNNIIVNGYKNGYALRVAGYADYLKQMENNCWHSVNYLIDYYGRTYNSIDELNGDSGLGSRGFIYLPIFKSSDSPDITEYYDGVITTNTISGITKYIDGTVRNENITFVGAAMGVKSAKVNITDITALTTSVKVTAQFTSFDSNVKNIVLKYGEHKSNLVTGVNFSETTLSSNSSKALFAEVSGLKEDTKYYVQAEYYSNGETRRTDIFELRTSLDLNRVTINIAANELIGTTPGMEYNINNSGKWITCGNGKTTGVMFDEGKVIVRSKSVQSNIRTITTLKQSAAPDKLLFEIDYYKEHFVVNVDNIEMSVNGAEFVAVAKGSYAVAPNSNGFGDKNVRIRYVATKLTLASKTSTFIYPERRAAPTNYRIEYDTESIKLPTIKFDIDITGKGFAKVLNTASDISSVIPDSGNRPLKIKLRASADKVSRQFCSATKEITIKARPVSPNFLIDFANEIIGGGVPNSVEYGYKADMSDAKTGNGKFDITVPAVGEKESYIHFRYKATNSNFRSKIFRLTVPARPKAPVCKLHTAAGAYKMLMLKPEGSSKFIQAKAGHDIQISYDGNIWNNFTGALINGSGKTKIYVRFKPAAGRFRSASSANLYAPIDISTVDIDIAKGIISNTTNLMSYYYEGSIVKKACTVNTTKVTFKQGTLVVYETSNSVNKRRFVIAAPKNISQIFSVDFVNEKTNEVVPANIEYRTTGKWSNSVAEDRLVITPGKGVTYIEFRNRATKSVLASKLFRLKVPAIPDAPVLAINITDKELNNFTAAMEYVSSENNVLARLTPDADIAHNAAPAGGNLDVTPFIKNFNEAAIYIHVRERATNASFRSDYSIYKVNKRFADINPAVNVITESIDPNADVYNYNFGNGTVEGKGVITTTIVKQMIESASSNRELILYRPTTNQFYESNKVTLTVKKRRAKPYVILSDRASVNAHFIIDINGTTRRAKTSDNLEFSLNGVWSDITSATEVNTVGDNNIKVRFRYSADEFRSEATDNLDTKSVLGGVTINILTSELIGTTNKMEYSVNSTDGINGDWSGCGNVKTDNVGYKAGKVYIREAGNKHNFKLIAELTKAKAPYLKIDSYTEKSTTALSSDFEYADNVMFKSAVKGNNTKINLNAGTTVYIRRAATKTTLASDIQTLNIAVRPILSTTVSGTTEYKEVHFTIDFKRSVTNFNWRAAITNNSNVTEYKHLGNGKYIVTIKFVDEGDASVSYPNGVVDEDNYKTDKITFKYKKAQAKNTAPYQNGNIDNQTFNVNQHFSFNIPSGTFADNDKDDVLTLSAKLVDGSALPGWLIFDNSANSFSGVSSSAVMLNIRLTATDKAGSTAYVDFILDIVGVTSINNPEVEDVKVYPTHTAGLVYIETEAATRVSLFNIRGLLIKQVNIPAGKSSIDFSQFKGGLYIVKLEHDNKTTSFKVVKY